MSWMRSGTDLIESVSEGFVTFSYLFFFHHLQCHSTSNLLESSTNASGPNDPITSQRVGSWISTCWELKFFMLGADSDTLGDFLYKQREGRSGRHCFEKLSCAAGLGLS